MRCRVPRRPRERDFRLPQFMGIPHFERLAYYAYLLQVRGHLPLRAHVALAGLTYAICPWPLASRWPRWRAPVPVPQESPPPWL